MRYEQLQGTHAACGWLHFVAYHADGRPKLASLFVKHPVATEFDWMDADAWPLDRNAANEEHFFGPTEAA